MRPFGASYPLLLLGFPPRCASSSSPSSPVWFNFFPLLVCLSRSLLLLSVVILVVHSDWSAFVCVGWHDKCFFFLFFIMLPSVVVFGGLVFPTSPLEPPSQASGTWSAISWASTVPCPRASFPRARPRLIPSGKRRHRINGPYAPSGRGACTYATRGQYAYKCLTYRFFLFPPQGQVSSKLLLRFLHNVLSARLSQQQTNMEGARLSFYPLSRRPEATMFFYGRSARDVLLPPSLYPLNSCAGCRTITTRMVSTFLPSTVAGVVYRVLRACP